MSFHRDNLLCLNEIDHMLVDEVGKTNCDTFRTLVSGRQILIQLMLFVHLLRYLFGWLVLGLTAL